MKPFAAALAIVLTVGVVAVADVSGTWNVDGDVVGNVVKFTCVLKQSGEALSGTAAIEGQTKDLPMTGTVKDRTVTLQFDIVHEGTTYTNVYTGTLQDNGAIEGSIAVGGVEGRFTMKKSS